MVCFLSYAHRPLDEVACRAVASSLLRHDIPHWWDRNLTTQRGAALNAEISGALARSQAVVFIASSQSMASPYCQAEIVTALETDKRVLRIDVEPATIPHELLPLASAPRLAYSVEPEFEGRLIAALASLGVAPGPKADGASSLALLDVPDAAVIRPSYTLLRGQTADSCASYIRRLTTAARLAPGNGYTHLSLALLHLADGDVRRALTSAQAAASLVPREPDAHYAEALARCASTTPRERTLTDVETILRQLAVARQLPRAGAHVDLLSALVIANYYGPAYLTPPAAPDDLLRRGLSLSRCDFGENRRVLDTEPLPPRAFMPDSELLLKYLAPDDRTR